VLARRPSSPPPPAAPPTGVLGRGIAGPPCTARRVGFLFGFGGMPQPSFTPASSGGAGGRRTPLPLRRSWRTAAWAGSLPSSQNNPARIGLKLRWCGLARPSRSRHGGGNSETSLVPLPCGLDPESPVVGGLICRWRALQQVGSPPLPDQGCRDWKRWTLLLFVGVAALLLLTFLPAGRGGEGYGVRCGVAVAGGNPRPFPSSEGGVVEMLSLIAPTWCDVYALLFL
jgi:hypothetical protein